MKNALIAILIVLLLILGYFFLQNKKSAKLYSTDNWATTIFGGLTIMYPPIWQIRANTNAEFGKSSSIISDIKVPPSNSGELFATINMRTEPHSNCTNGILTQTNSAGVVSTIGGKCAIVEGVLFSILYPEKPELVRIFDIIVKNAKSTN